MTTLYAGQRVITINHLCIKISRYSFILFMQRGGKGYNNVPYNIPANVLLNK